MTDKQLREPMSHVDATWLGMDESTNLMIINGVMLFAERVDFDQLLQMLNERLVAKYDRFSQCVVAPKGPPSLGIGRLYWEDDPHFDIRSHVYHIALPAPGDTAALQRLVGQLTSEPLDRTRPLWRMYLIDSYGEGCALYSRLHHAIGDGIALMRVLLSLTDPEPVPEPVRGAPAAVVSRNLSGAPVRTSGLLAPASRRRGMAGWAAGAMVGAARAVGSRGPGALWARRGADPEGAKETAREVINMLKATGIIAAATTANLAKLALMAKDRDSVYRGELTPIKRVSWSKPIALERVKGLGKVTGATVNDVLVASVTGGLRRYIAAVDGQDQDSPGQVPGRGDIRATVPVNLRPPDAPLTLGNKFSLVYLTLPLSIADPYQRLYEVKRRMDALKRSPEPLLVYEILKLLGMIPGPVSRRVSNWLASKATCVLTNVPGPRKPVYLADRRVDRLMFWVPQSRGVGMGISIISYAGDVIIGLMADEALVPDPARVVDEFYAEFEDLERLAAPAQAGADRPGQSRTGSGALQPPRKRGQGVPADGKSLSTEESTRM